MWSRRGLVGVLFAASLMVNLFLIGVFVGNHLLAGVKPAPWSGFAPAAKVRRLAPEERARFAAAIKPYRPAIRAARGRVWEARAQVVDDIAAPALDKGRLETDLGLLRKEVQDQQLAQHAGLAAALVALSPASRATLTGRVQGARAIAPVSDRVGKSADGRS